MVTKQVFPGAVGGSISVIASSKFVKGSNPQWKKVLIIFFNIFISVLRNLNQQDWKPFQPQDDEYKWYDKQYPHSLFLRNTKKPK